MPVAPRSRSVARLANDRLILDSALAEAAAAGVDGLGFGAVASRAGVTSGAMYSRYADARDLLAALWVERLHAPTRDLLVGCTRLMLEQPGTSGAEIVRRVSRMSRAQKVGIEALVTARRVPELEDVVAGDIAALLGELGLQGRPAGLGTLRSALALGTVLACALNRFWEPDIDEWSTIIDFYGLTCTLMTPADRVRSVRGTGPVSVSTGSALRDVLVQSTADVVSRSGVASTTVARITRRARMTSGAVYTLYGTKDELLLDSMQLMLDSASSDVTAVVNDGAARGAVADATDTVFALAFAPERLPWRRFRLETYMAARTDRRVAAIVRRIQRESLGRYRSMFEPQGMSEETIRLLSRSGQNHPVGFSLLEIHMGMLGELDFRPFSTAMLEAQRIVGR